MLRVHRDFKGLLKDVQDEYDFLAELNKSLQKKVAEWNKDEEIQRVWVVDGASFIKINNGYAIELDEPEGFIKVGHIDGVINKRSQPTK